MDELSDRDLDRYRAALERRLDALREEIRAGTAEESGQRFADLAGEVRDSGEESVGIEQSNLRNAMIGRDIGEVRSIEAALARMEQGEYGYCIRCGGDIGVQRLDVQPDAARCTRCQANHERNHAGTGPAASL